MLFAEHREGTRRLGMRISIEADVASGVSFSRQVSSRPFAPIEVYVRHATPEIIKHHEAYFGFPVHSERTRMRC